ncbi:MAG: excisionase family DNA-binding protein [Streptosporangiaceae bacterium]
MTQTLLTSSQAGKLLGVSGRTVRRMVEREELEAVQRLPRGDYLFDADEVQKVALRAVMGSVQDEPEQDLQ